jgi:hypothetical protein
LTAAPSPPLCARRRRACASSRLRGAAPAADGINPLRTKLHHGQI